MMSDVNSDLEALAFMVEHTIDELRAATDARNVAKTKAEEARASSLPTLEAALAATELNLVARGADFQRSNDNYMKYNLAPMSRRGGAPAPAAAAPTAAKDPDVGEKRKRALRSKEQVVPLAGEGETWLDLHNNAIHRIHSFSAAARKLTVNRLRLNHECICEFKVFVDDMYSGIAGIRQLRGPSLSKPSSFQAPSECPVR